VRLVAHEPAPRVGSGAHRRIIATARRVSEDPGGAPALRNRPRILSPAPRGSPAVTTRTIAIIALIIAVIILVILLT
jgi:hypothetical protein